MGYDVWGGSDPEETYIQQCFSSQKYKKGRWYTLEDEAGKIVSSLICYKNIFGLSDGCVGIGSIATMPRQRQKGYATHLLKNTVENLREEKIQHIFLYADINPAFYENLGFKALDEKEQKYKPSICMTLNAVQRSGEFAVPSYF